MAETNPVRTEIQLASIASIVRQRSGRARILTPTEVTVLSRWAERIIEFIQARWPVDTGRSRAAWEWVIDNNATLPRILLLNDVDYSGWVHRAGAFPGAALWAFLVQDAWELARGPLRADMDRAIRQTEAQRQVREVARLRPRAIGRFRLRRAS